MEKINIFWFRRDLRINDNCGFYNLLNDKKNVLPLFIFDKNILDKLVDKTDKRVKFIHQELQEMKNEFEKNGSSFLIEYGYPDEIWKSLTEKYDIESVYTNHDYEPYAKDRDKKVSDYLKSKKIEFKTFKDQVIFEKDEILSGQNKSYTVYTPYKNKWREEFSKISLEFFPSENNLDKLYKMDKLKNIYLDDIRFIDSVFKYPSKKINDDIVINYDKNRDFPAKEETSRISLHLRFGTVSVRECVSKAKELNDVWFNELIWREFFMMILNNYPDVVNNSFRKEYDNIKWLNNQADFDKWCNGKTGYPIVDAGMRQLNQTGYMHNRVRLVTASFLTKHLLIDWRWGEKYFAEKLLDYELSSNNGNWQWCAGTGCDAAPYFRVFNPDAQTERFDPKYEYIKKWVTEYETFKYPKPIVEHKFARNRALAAYKEALGK